MQSSLPVVPEEKTEKGPGYIGAASLLLVLVIVAVSAFFAYLPALSVGFLLDDFSHLDYAYKALQGNWSDLVRVFTGNWTGAVDNLTAYRPFISLSFALDALIWKMNPFGFHVSNLIMFAGCSVATSLLAFELSGALSGPRTRLVTALAAGLLFVFYPLHPEAVVWIIGRVDVQCGLFYLASLYGYLRFRRTGGQLPFVLSLLAFACALPSKEMAVTLPAAIFLAEIILPGESLGWKVLSIKKRAAAVGAYFALLGVFAIIRTAALGTLVGGYGGGGLKQFIRCLGNFCDAATWSKIIYGVNEEMPQPANGPLIARAGFISCGVSLLLRFSESRAFWRVLGFLVLWAGVSELPTYQIWHVFPNLCGSRLLFIPSAPFCMILSILALTPIAFLAVKLRQQKWALSMQALGALSLSAIAFAWSQALSTNFMAWTVAGEQMRTLTDQVRRMAESVPQNSVVLLLDLPQDVSGSGLLGRPEFLERLLRPPLYNRNRTSSIMSAELPYPGHSETTYPEMVEKLNLNSRVWRTCKWNSKQGRYLDWDIPDGAMEFQDVELRQLKPDPSAGNSLVWLNKLKINPFQVRMIEVELASDADLERLKAQLQLVWKSENQPESWIDYSACSAAHASGCKIVFYPARLRTWLYNGSVNELGLLLPPGATLAVKSVAGSKGSTMMPVVSIEKSQGTGFAIPQELVVTNINRDDGLTLEYDCARIQGATGARVVMLAGAAPFPDQAFMGIPPGAKIIGEGKTKGLKGKVKLQAGSLPASGLFQLAVVAVNDEGKPVSFVSDPVTIRISK